jgi:hypothetical protein
VAADLHDVWAFRGSHDGIEQQPRLTGFEPPRDLPRDAPRGVELGVELGVASFAVAIAGHPSCLSTCRAQGWA